MLTQDEREWMIAEWLAELQEYKNFEAFYESIPKLYAQRKTHTPLIYITSADSEDKLNVRKVVVKEIQDG